MCIFLDIQNHDFVVFGKIREKWAHFSALAILKGKDTYLFCSCYSTTCYTFGKKKRPQHNATAFFPLIR